MKYKIIDWAVAYWESNRIKERFKMSTRVRVAPYKDVIEQFVTHLGGQKAYDFLVYSKSRVEIIDKHGNVLKTVKYKAFEKFVFETLCDEEY